MHIFRPSLAVPAILLVAACSSPPKPPTVDESHKRPVNSPMAVELQVCRNDLHNTRLLAAESGRLADSTAATLASLAARQQALVAMSARQAPAPAAPLASAPEPSQPNRIFTVRFDFGSTQVVIPAEIGRTLAERAKAAPLVLLRGRTDGRSDSPAESHIARERAAAVRDWLVAAGVDPARIRATYQPAGDPVADNSTPGGRQLNRRVEVELYQVLPLALSATTAQP